MLYGVDPWYSAANFAPFQQKHFCCSKRNNYAHLICKMMYIHMLFSHVRRKVYFRRYGRQTCVVIFHSLLIYPTQKPHITEVALNSVL